MRTTRDTKPTDIDRFIAQHAITIPSAERPSVPASTDTFLLERLKAYIASINGDRPLTA